SDIEHIVNTYRDFTAGKLKPGVAEEKYSYVATFEEIQENDFNLNIPRYVDTFEEEAEVDIAAVQKEIDSLVAELKMVQQQIDKYLKKLLKKYYVKISNPIKHHLKARCQSGDPL